MALAERNNGPNDYGTTGTAAKLNGQTIGSLVSSITVSLVVFAIQLGLFLFLRRRLPRIYEPKTYLVPKKNRIPAPPRGTFAWIKPIFHTSNSDFIQRCGLDAYFFLRYLRMLLRIFVPLGIFIIAILIPINVKSSGKDHTGNNASLGVSGNVTGLNVLAWPNVSPEYAHRLWVHLFMALCVIVWTCYNFYEELRGYIRMRQAFLTSPQHRLRASATTVLVTNVPRKWLTYEALDGLYDVFPGGIRNIWINRNYDDLQTKVDLRRDYAKMLESAETELIRKAMKAHTEKFKKTEGKSKKKPQGPESKGNPAITQQPPSLDGNETDQESKPTDHQADRELLRDPTAAVRALGTGVGKLGNTVTRGIGTVKEGVDKRFESANFSGGFVTNEDALCAAGSDDIARDPLINRQQSPSSQDTLATSPKARPSTQDEHLGEPSNIESNDFALHLPSKEDAAPTSEPSQNAEKASDPQSSARMDGTTESRPISVGAMKASNLVQTLQLPEMPTIFSLSKSKKSAFPSPQPHYRGDEQFPLDENTDDLDPTRASLEGRGSVDGKFSNKSEKGTPTPYPDTYDKDYEEDDVGEPLWKKYIEEKDRPTMRLKPISWLPGSSCFGHKVDKIYHCRRELARLNAEIEMDQAEYDKYPLMNSAFIQFNHQAAAHMACQSLSHHVPKSMAPRLIEVSPRDVKWTHLSTSWWYRWVKTVLIWATLVVLIIFWAIPVVAVSSLSSLGSLTNISWLSWLDKLGTSPASIIGGLAPALVGLLIGLMPYLFYLFAALKGMPTGAQAELSVQNYYFIFSFAELFFVVTISQSLIQTLPKLAQNPTSIPQFLATNLPRGSNFFFYYLIIQGMSISTGALVQVLQLFFWFIWAKINDSTARQKFQRQINLNNFGWGSLFPVYTNLASIGLIYSVIAPLIMVFNIISFSLFWFVHRYNSLYVYKFKPDTGGLLFPSAINQLFVGLYVMELCLVGLFFLISSACRPQAIIMIVAFVLTAIYQWILNDSFGPLFKYIPITMEDDAVRRDEEFARIQNSSTDHERLIDGEQEGEDIEDTLEAREEQEQEADREAEQREKDAFEMRKIQRDRKPSLAQDKSGLNSNGATSPEPADKHGYHFGWGHNRRGSERRGSELKHSEIHRAVTGLNLRELPSKVRAAALPELSGNAEKSPQTSQDLDVEAQEGANIAHLLYKGYNDTLEELTPEQRDVLVREAFLHQAVRARRPTVWIPRDELGISDDEIKRTRKLSKWISISNDGAGLDAKNKVIFGKAPPDFQERDLIDL